MSKNKSDQNAHEEQVFNDVLRLSMASGGYKKKAALKVCGSINAGSECPDIVITRENGSIVGLEHFRIDHNIKHGRNAQSKSAELTSALKAEREKLMPRLEADDVLPEELASIVANYVSLAKYHQSCACRDDLTRSLDARLFGGKTGHARNYLNTAITLLNLAVMMDALNWAIYNKFIQIFRDYSFTMEQEWPASTVDNAHFMRKFTISFARHLARSIGS